MTPTRLASRQGTAAPRRVAGTCLALAIAALAAGCDTAASPAECRAMLDRYVGMVAADPAAKAAQEDGPAFARAQQQCEREVTRREVRCAMNAPTPERWEACID